jgi:hypothetical protein
MKKPCGIPEPGFFDTLFCALFAAALALHATLCPAQTAAPAAVPKIKGVDTWAELYISRLCQDAKGASQAKLAELARYNADIQNAWTRVEAQYRKDWKNAEAALENDKKNPVLARAALAARQEYLFYIGVATSKILATQWVAQTCLPGMRAGGPVNNPGRPFNVCGTGGPLNCTGKFQGRYSSMCRIRGEDTHDSGTGELTLDAKGKLNLLLTSARDRSTSTYSGEYLVDGSAKLYDDGSISKAYYEVQLRTTAARSDTRVLTGGGSLTNPIDKEIVCRGNFTLGQ